MPMTYQLGLSAAKAARILNGDVRALWVPLPEVTEFRGTSGALAYVVHPSEDTDPDADDTFVSINDKYAGFRVDVDLAELMDSAWDPNPAVIMSVDLTVMFVREIGIHDGYAMDAGYPDAHTAIETYTLEHIGYTTGWIAVLGIKVASQEAS